MYLAFTKKSGKFYCTLFKQKFSNNSPKRSKTDICWICDKLTGHQVGQQDFPCYLNENSTIGRQTTFFFLSIEQISFKLQQVLFISTLIQSNMFYFQISTYFYMRKVRQKCLESIAGHGSYKFVSCLPSDLTDHIQKKFESLVGQLCKTE